MQYNFVDLTGQRFGRLTVIKREKNYKYNTARWLCKCDCGGQTITSTGHLKSGHTKSCGCFSKEIAKQKALKNTYFFKHGLSNNKKFKRISYIMTSMKSRCYNYKNRNYKDYGGRGITICNYWLDEQNGLMNFYNWALNNGYRQDLSIDRIDNNGNYEPNNCRWATAKQQANNKRNTLYIEYNNEKHTINEWAKLLNIPEKTLRNRINHKWQVKKAFNQPWGHNKTILQYDLEGNFLNKFSSIKEAQNKTKISSISACCRGIIKQAGGYIWRYADEYYNKLADNCGEPK